MAYAQLTEGKTTEQIEDIDFALETALLSPVDQAARRNARAMKKWTYKPPVPPVPPHLRRAS